MLARTVDDRPFAWRCPVQRATPQDRRAHVTHVIPALRIQLLGDFAFLYDNRVMPGINTPRLQSLVAYLVLHRSAPPLRQHIAFSFWPDSSEAQARNNLRQLVHAVRGILPEMDNYLAVNHATLSWRQGVPIWCDVDEFERACAAVDEAEARHDRVALRSSGQQILECYRADLLPTCYDDWIVPERERLRARYLRALNQLIESHSARQEYDQAIPFARRRIRADPLDEGGYRGLMRLLALSGDRAGAMKTFQACAQALERELGIGPDQTTLDLFQQLQLADAQGNARGSVLAETERAQRQPSSPAPEMVGRGWEWERLQTAWNSALAGRAGFALIAGEAGIGKSRLAAEMVRWARHQGATTASARAYAVEGRLSLAPVIAWLRSGALRQYVQRLDSVWLTELARVLPELHAEHSDLPSYEPIDDYGQRQRFFHALARATLAAPSPLLLVLDDLQWCDQETLDWLHFLLHPEVDAQLLVVGTVRAEEAPPHHPVHTLLRHLRASVDVTEIALQPLDAAETAELAARMVDHELDTRLALRLFGETEGNPLFVVEIVRAGLDDLLSRPRPQERELLSTLNAPEMPSGMRTVIAGRLAQLSAPAHELASLAALVGREFSLDILALVSHDDEDNIVRALDELFQRRIVREHAPAVYDFTHDKLREVARAEISAPQRHLWHRRIARALETLHTDDLDSVSGQIAAHYEHGGMIEQASAYYHRAGLMARRVFAYDDAIRLLRHALTLLEQMRPGSARDRQELDLLLALAPIYRITRGWTAPELEQAVDRTLALCDMVGNDSQRAEALYGLQSLLVVQARLERVQLVGEELHALYERTQGQQPPLADMMLAGARLHLGRFSDANSAFNRILTPHDARQVQHLEDSQGWNYEVHTRAWHAHALWCLGYPDSGLRLGREAVQLADSFEQPFNRALAVTYLALLWQINSDDDTARRMAEEALALTNEYRAPYYRAWATILVCYAQARDQPDEAHIAALRAAIEQFKETGARLRLPYYLALVADIALAAGRLDEGMAAIEEALERSRATEERWWDAELHRVRGNVLLALGADLDDAHAAFVRARSIARTQQARSLELRAMLSAARSYGDQRPPADIRNGLNDLYSSFTEGYEMPDLQAAQALLERWR